MYILIQGNAINIPLPDSSVQTVVTSPPYFGLRDYGLPPSVWGGSPDCLHEWNYYTRRGQTGGTASHKVHIKGAENYSVVPNQGQAVCRVCGAWLGTYGLEHRFELYIQHTVEIFREVKRVLRDDGTVWLVIGDSFNGSGGAGGDYNKGGLKEGQPRYPGRNVEGLKPKDLIGIPWRVALALQNDGWYLRSDVIWEKPNVMPSSAKDRPTNNHEHIFLFSKAKSYFYDWKAIAEPKADGTGMRNRRDVWRVSTRGFKGAHFATFPPKLIEPCILAGSKPGDLVLDPFVGSGTTVAVAIQHNRIGVGLELNPAYLQLAQKRVDAAVLAKL